MSGYVEERVRVDIEEHVLVLTLTRADKRNAIDGEMTQAIDRAMNRLDDDPDLWVGIITGGPDIFCAGTDMALTSGPPTERGGIYGVVGRTRTKPLIAAVEGFAFGGGFEVVMACDMVVAADNVRFGLPEVKRGLVASSGALLRVQRVLPLNVARHVLLTGTDLSAVDAERHGLVNVLTAPGQALTGAREVAAAITANAPLAVQHSLAVVNQLVGATDDHGWKLTREARDANMATEDAKEGVAAFFDKRPPEWQAR